MEFKNIINNLKNNKENKALKIGIITLVVIIIAAFMFYLSGISAADKNDEELVSINIPTGTGVSQIIEILDENGFVKNKLCAKIHVKLGGYDTLQANNYLFSRDMSISEIFKAINTGDFNYLSKNAITIVDGFTVPDAAAAIAEKTSFKKSEIIEKWADVGYLRTLIDKYWFLTEDILNSQLMFPLEGYLYPETYFVTDTDPTIESITEMILDKTAAELDERKDEIKESSMTVHELLTLASIVQNESLFEEDRAKIAGVFMNRLEQGMPLQSDITVLYALQEKRVEVTYDDLAVDSLYNTYLYTGLPVGPVCGVAGYAIDATINYEKSDYLYFFATKDGKVIYNKTLSEHEKTVEENLWY